MDDFSPEDKYFMLYCLTNPHTNIIGCYEISMKQMAAELGYSVDAVMSLIKRFREHHGVIDYDGETKELYVKNWHKYNWTESPKLNPSIVSALDTVKTPRFKQRIADLYNARDTVSIPYEYGMDTTDTVTDTVSDSDKKIIKEEKTKRKIFVPPNVEEVAAYCRERGNTVDPETFVDFYAGKDWMVGKNKMVDWKATVRTWERRQKNEQKLRETPPRDAFLEFLDEEAAKARGT